MITIKTIQAEISEIKNRIEKEEMKKAAENRLRKRIVLLNQCRMYIETSSSNDFIAAEIIRISEKISLRMGGFKEGDYNMVSRKDFGKIKKDYEKMYEIPKLRLQLKVLKFLLAESNSN